MTTALRCAIYTRVSSDAGLEQDFNSLDAQRESAEVYIKSQAHEGWRLVRERYDDGGYSGGSTDRPALQRLLDRIRERRVDVVVVYKVDRLTVARRLRQAGRTLRRACRFLRLRHPGLQYDEQHGPPDPQRAAVLQFEREVTGERIRDKIAASKKKGLWMGGVVPLGYRLEKRKLYVDEDEAATVRLIFDLYLELGSIRALQRELKRQDVCTRVRTLTTGKTVGGVHRTNGPLSHILRNRHYLGEINHRGRSWPGEHPAVIDPETFEKVQVRLEQQRVARGARLRSRALLLGKLFNEPGERLTPTYVTKGGVRCGYYVSTSAMQSRDRVASPMHRLPAAALETAVVDALRSVVERRGPKGAEIEASTHVQPMGCPVVGIAQPGAPPSVRPLPRKPRP